MARGVHPGTRSRSTMLLGTIVLLAGIALLAAARRERALLPPGLDRAGAGTIALGLSVLCHQRGGMRWDLASIALGAIAVSLLLSVVVANLKRR